MRARAEVVNLRVLIVDDNATYRRTIRRILSTSAGLEVVGEAVDGQDSLYQVENLRPNVVLMDCSMPGMDGPEAVRRLRVLHPEVRVVALTVGDDDDCLREMRSSGVSQILYKGVGPEEISRAIRAAG